MAPERWRQSGGPPPCRHRERGGICCHGQAYGDRTAHLDDAWPTSRLRDYVIDRILKNIPEARLNGGRTAVCPTMLNISFPGLEGETILLDLDMHGICASTGSACNSTTAWTHSHAAEHQRA